eukprot:COSAG01_NODE_4264_length_5198_cov_3.619337_4_plen_380_part_00
MMPLQVPHVDTLCFAAPGVVFVFLANMLAGRGVDIPAELTSQWKDLLLGAVHVCCMMKAADLTLRTRSVCVQYAPLCAVRGIASVTTLSSKHDVLTSKTFIDALLYASAHDNFWVGGDGISAHASVAAVNLIGRNEDGLTLTQGAVDKLLALFGNYFDESHRRWKYPAKKVIVEAKSLVHLTVPDCNKAFVVEHAGALDSLVAALLVDEANHRRGQQMATELQQSCAVALQNLALSPIGARPLRAHEGAMAALRQLASTSSEAAMSEKARQAATGALFELDETIRQKAKAAAKRRRGSISAGSTHAQLLAQIKGGDPDSDTIVEEAEQEEEIEHIMLSYNWGHQEVIKRINVALKARGYTVWIDVVRLLEGTHVVHAVI